MYLLRQLLLLLLLLLPCHHWTSHGLHDRPLWLATLQSCSAGLTLSLPLLPCYVCLPNRYLRPCLLLLLLLLLLQLLPPLLLPQQVVLLQHRGLLRGGQAGPLGVRQELRRHRHACHHHGVGCGEGSSKQGSSKQGSGKQGSSKQGSSKQGSSQQR